jgi:hypothetical protein
MARNGAGTQPDLQVLTLVAEFRFESEFGESFGCWLPSVAAV